METEAQTGKGTHPRSESPTFWRRQAGLGQYTHLPYDGQLHGTPSVSSPVHQARQEVSNESPCNCGQEQGEPGQGTYRGTSPLLPTPNQEFTHSLGHSLTHLLGERLSLFCLECFIPCKWSLRNNTPGLNLDLSLHLLCPRGDVGTHLLGESRDNKLGMLRSAQPFPIRSI